MGRCRWLRCWVAVVFCGSLLWTTVGLGDELTCEPAPGGGTALSAAPTLLATLADRWHQAWLGSPVVADLDADGVNEVLATRHHLLLGWHLDGTVVYRVQGDDTSRFYAPPVVGDIDASSPGLEVAAAAGAKLYLWSAAGVLRPGFPVTWLDELRAVAADDIDGDGALELVVVSTQTLDSGGQSDVIMAYEADGQAVTGFPPNTTGASGCDSDCYVYGGFGETLALGDLDGDEAADLVVPHDNESASVHRGDGEMFDASSVFTAATKFAGVRSFFDYDSAKQGWSPDPDNENVTVHTTSAPAIADLDGNGTPEIILLGTAANVALTDYQRGVALWVLNSDGTRASGWETPYHASDYLAGLWPPPGDNLIGITNEVTVAELDASTEGLEMIFPGFDGAIHAVSSARQLLWRYEYTTDPDVMTSGVLVVDLSGDGLPEVVFNTYSADAGDSSLFVLGADGSLQRQVSLSGRGAMPVPTVADVDKNGSLEIVVSHKDAVDLVRQVEVYTVAGSSANCMLWPTGRGNPARSGFVPELAGVDILENGSFEDGGRLPDHWRGKKLSRRDKRVEGTYNSGQYSFKMKGTRRSKTLKQSVEVSGSAGDTFDITAWSKAVKPNRKGGAYQVVVKLFYTDDTKENQKLKFPKKTHGWKKRSAELTADKDYSRIVVTAQYSRQKGKVWFDDIQMTLQ